MSAMDEFVRLKQQRAVLATLHWSCQTPSVRMFYTSGEREYSVDAREKELMQAAVGDVERDSKGQITYYGGDAIGRALQACTLKYVDKELKRLAVLAKEQAESCLEALKGEQ